MRYKKVWKKGRHAQRWIQGHGSSLPSLFLSSATLRASVQSVKAAMFPSSQVLLSKNSTSMTWFLKGPIPKDRASTSEARTASMVSYRSLGFGSAIKSVCGYSAGLMHQSSLPIHANILALLNLTGHKDRISIFISLSYCQQNWLP